MLSIHLLLVLSPLFLQAAFAIMVTQPAEGATWRSKGPNQVSWVRVNTDPTNVAITLVHLGVFIKTLATNVDATKGTITINDNDLPVGNGYQINIVKSAQEVNTILAQSPQIAITESGGSSGGNNSGPQGPTIPNSPPQGSSPMTSNGPIPSGVVVGPGDSSNPNLITSSAVSLEPTASSAGFQTSAKKKIDIIGLLTLLGFVLD